MRCHRLALRTVAGTSAHLGCRAFGSGIVRAMDVRSAVRDRLMCPMLAAPHRARRRPPTVRLGTDYGGWWVPRDVLTEGAVAYCAGVGEDISFDTALAEHGLEVWAFDPTPRSVAFMAEHRGSVRLEPIGWWHENTTLHFHPPSNPGHVSHSVDNLQGTSTGGFDADVQTVRTVADRLGHDRVMIVKMDIEGAEYRVVPHLLEHGPWPDVLCVEFDYPYRVTELRAMLAHVVDAGYAIARVDRSNVTFVRN